jgi:hypothetical protein
MHYHFSVTPCSTHYAALAHALLTGLLALIIHAILYPGISKVFAVTVKTSQEYVGQVNGCGYFGHTRLQQIHNLAGQVAMLGSDFVNLPFC